MRSVATLSTGIGLAQLIVIAASPILTRIYDPGDLGVLSAFAAVLGISLIAGSWRYERAIPLAASSRIVTVIIQLGALVLIVNACLLAVALIWLRDPIADLLNAPEISRYLWLLPVGLLFGGIYELLTFTAVRMENYPLLARTKVSQSLGLVTTQIGLGLAGAGPLGLILGDVVGRSLGIYSLGSRMREQWTHRPRRYFLAHLRSVAWRYWQFPLLSTPSGILSRSASMAPQLWFVALYDTKVAGLVFLAQHTVLGPLVFLGRSVAKVFLGIISRERREGGDQIPRLIKTTAKRLFILGIVPIGILAWVGPSAFAWLFGAEWAEAGLFARYLAFGLLFQFSIAPLLQTLIVLERQGRLVIFDSIRFLAVAAAVAITHHFGGDAHQAVISYSVALALCYFVGFLLVYGTARVECADTSG